MEFKREKYLNKLIDRKENGLIKIITGARRVGKSYLLNEIFYRYLLNINIPDSQIIKFAFDSDEDIDLLDDYFPSDETRIIKNNSNFVNSKKFRAYIKSKTNNIDKFYLLLDEVQLLDNFVGTLNSFLRHRNYDIYVTGSNSKFLSSDIATEFKGRGSEIHVLPLAFSEYCIGLNISKEKSWKDYIETGGIPLVALMKSLDERISYLKNLCNETYLKDIIQHNNIIKSNELSDTFNILASNIGLPVNCLKLANTFISLTNKKITDDTIADFVEYFQDAYIISKVNKYNIKGKKYMSTPFKIYFEDIGVRNARLNFRQIEETHIMENIIFNELRYRGFNVDIGEINISEKTDRKDINGKNIYAQKSLEVDFIATLGNRKYYIQSALSLESSEKRLQEVKSLYYIDDSFKKIIVTKNGLNTSVDEKGVVIIDLFDFLLNQNSLEN